MATKLLALLGDSDIDAAHALHEVWLCYTNTETHTVCDVRLERLVGITADTSDRLSVCRVFSIRCPALLCMAVQSISVPCYMAVQAVISVPFPCSVCRYTLDPMFQHQ